MNDSTRSEQSYGCVPIHLRGDGQFLLVQHLDDNGDPDHWSFPKGHPEEFEHKTDTVLRELEEETGLLPDDFLEEPVFSEEYSYTHADGYTVEKKNTYYLAFFANPREPVIDNEEINDARWVEYEEALELITHEESQAVLREVYLHLNMNGLL